MVGNHGYALLTENVELKNGEMTRTGFISLNQMEAEDNEGDAEDLWVTLNSMGYNRSLVQDEVGYTTAWRELAFCLFICFWFSP